MLVDAAKKHGYVKDGEVTVITAGVPLGRDRHDKPDKGTRCRTYPCKGLLYK